MFLCSDMKSQNFSEKDIKTYIDQARNKDLDKDLRLRHLQNAHGLVKKMADDVAKTTFLLEISRVYYLMGDEKLFLELNKEVYDQAVFQNDSLKIAGSLRNSGIYYRNKSQLDSAYYSFFQSSKIYHKLEEKVLEGRTLLSMAIAQKNVKDYTGSEVTTIRALKCFEGSENYFQLFSSYNNLGIISSELGRYEDAIKYHESAYEYAKKIVASPSSQVISLNNLGLTYEKKGVYLEAIEVYKKALTYKEVMAKSPGFYAIILDNIAYAKFRLGDFRELPDLFYKPLKICDTIANTKDNVKAKISIKLHLAEYFRSTGALEKSKKCAIDVRMLAKKHDYNADLLSALLLLSKVSEGKEALFNAQRYIHLNDSLQQQERTTRDQFARIRFETDILEEEKEKVTKQKELLILVIAGILLLAILLFVIFKQQQRNKELIFAQEQRKANEEIYRLMLSQQVKLEEGRQLEKRRVSEELHDGVLGRLFGTRLGLDGLNQRQGDDQAPKRGEYISELASIEKEIRRISHDLSSNTFISEVAFVEVVEKLVREHSEIHKLGYEFENHPAIIWEEIKDAVKINIYRIIQEALQNIAKHSQAKNVEIRFDIVADQIKITILDDGIGFKKYNIKKGIGLKNISSRVKEIKGSVSFTNNEGPGAKVVVTLALPE